MAYGTELFVLNLGFRYKNFGMNAMFQGAGMYTAYLGTVGVWTPIIDGANLSKEYYNNCWDERDPFHSLTSHTTLTTTVGERYFGTKSELL